MPADDPLNNGTRQHDEAVRELQGESIGELVVEASLRSDLHEHSQALKTNKSNKSNKCKPWLKLRLT